MYIRDTADLRLKFAAIGAFSQNEIAQAAGLSRPTAAKALAGQKISAQTATAIAKALSTQDKTLDPYELITFKRPQPATA